MSSHGLVDDGGQGFSVVRIGRLGQKLLGSCEDIAKWVVDFMAKAVGQFVGLPSGGRFDRFVDREIGAQEGDSATEGFLEWRFALGAQLRLVELA